MSKKKFDANEKMIKWMKEMDMKKSCCNCKFFDDSLCCMYDCACMAILNEWESAKECGHYCKGEYNVDELEKNNYK